MKTEAFNELLTSMNEALEHAQGKRSLRTTTLPKPPAPFSSSAIKRVRAKFQASQAVFAGYLNVSSKLVQAWEAGRRQPEGPALVLLHLVSKQPALMEAIRRDTLAPVVVKRRSSKAARHAAAV
jgi:putative transcriptional regulator